MQRFGMLWEGTELSQSEAFDIKYSATGFWKPCFVRQPPPALVPVRVAVKNIAESKLVYQQCDY
jgi:hypothetical protein